MNASLHAGDVVTINGSQRGRIMAIGEVGTLVLVQPHGCTEMTTCRTDEVRRVDSWWNTPEKRAAFAGPRGIRRRPGFARATRTRKALSKRAALASARRTKATRPAASGGSGGDGRRHT